MLAGSSSRQDYGNYSSQASQPVTHLNYAKPADNFMSNSISTSSLVAGKPMSTASTRPGTVSGGRLYGDYSFAGTKAGLYK